MSRVPPAQCVCVCGSFHICTHAPHSKLTLHMRISGVAKRIYLFFFFFKFFLYICEHVCCRDILIRIISLSVCYNIHNIGTHLVRECDREIFYPNKFPCHKKSMNAFSIYIHMYAFIIYLKINMLRTPQLLVAIKCGCFKWHLRKIFFAATRAHTHTPKWCTLSLSNCLKLCSNRTLSLCE